MTGESKQIILNTIGYSTTMFCQWLIILLVPKIGDFSDAGVFAIAISFGTLTNIIAPFSLYQYQVADQYQKYKENDYFYCRLYTTAFCMILGIIAIFAFNYSLVQALSVIFYMLYRMIIHYSSLYQASIQIKERLDYVGISLAVEGIVSLLSFLVSFMVWHNLPVSILFMSVLGGGVFFFMMKCGHYRIVGRDYQKKPFNHNKAMMLFVIGIPVMISNMVPIAITAAPKIILRMYETEEIVGIFGTLTAPTVIIPTVIGGVFSVFIIKFAHMYDNGDYRSIKYGYVKTTAIITLFGIASFIVSIFVEDFFFGLLYGDTIMPYTHYFKTLVAGMVLFSIGSCGNIILIIENRIMEAAVYSAVSLILSVVVMMVFIPSGSIDAAVYTLLLSYGLYALLISVCIFMKSKDSMKNDSQDTLQNRV